MKIKWENKLCIYVVNFIVFTISIVTSMYIYMDTNIVSGYELLYLLPLIFGLCFVLLLSQPLVESKSIYLYTFVLFVIIRYIALPFFMVFERYYTGLAYYPPLSLSVQNAIYLMIYEIIVSSLLIRFLYKRFLIYTLNRKEKKETQIEFNIKNKFIYIMVISFSLLIIVIYPGALRSISFFNNFNRGSGGNGIISSLSVQIIMLGKIILYFLLINSLHNRFIKTNKNKYIWLSYVVSFLNIGIFIGTNRKRVLMNAIASIVTLNHLYPRKSKKTLIIMLTFAFVLFFQLTIFRFYTGNDKSMFGDIAGTLQVYLSGPYNMALAIETRELYQNDISSFNVIYDIGRPFYGIGQLFKNINTHTSTEYFNMRLSIGGTLRTDQIMPITGQGLLHFGYILSPLYLILSIILGLFAERKLRNTKSFEKRYVLTMICIILGQSLGVNFIIITNIITFEGILFYIIYYFNYKVYINKSKHYKLKVMETSQL